MAHLTASLQQLGVATRQCWDRGDTGYTGDTRSCVEEEVRLGRAVVGLLLPATLRLDMDMQYRVTVYQDSSNKVMSDTVVAALYEAGMRYVDSELGRCGVSAGGARAFSTTAV